jgi:hypothetical protein
MTQFRTLDVMPAPEPASIPEMERYQAQCLKGFAD